MNKKKSRKNKKRRDHVNHSNSNVICLQPTYLDNFNLTQQQQSAIKFLSEALAISSQEAHIICNECKWEQSEFPSNLEAAQSMLHWNKKNTKSKSKREQNKYKQQLPKHEKNKKSANNTKNHSHVSPHHLPNKSPPKSSHNHTNHSPKFGGFVPHRTPNNNKATSPNKRHAHHRDNNGGNHDRFPAESTPKSNKNNRDRDRSSSSSQNTKKMGNNNGGGGNRVLLVSSSRILPFNPNLSNMSNHRGKNVANRRSSSPPNITAEMGPPQPKRAYMSPPSRGRSRGGYIPRGPSSRGRARGRGVMPRNVNNKYTKSQMHPQHAQRGDTKNLTLNGHPRRVAVSESPQSSSGSAQNSHNTAAANTMYVHEALEQELRREQQVNVIKLPKEFEKDLDPNLAQIFESPPLPLPPPPIPPPVLLTMNGHILMSNNEQMADTKPPPQHQPDEEHMTVAMHSHQHEHENHASMQISPKNASTSPQKMPSPIKPQAFLSNLNPENHADEFKEPSFMFIDSSQAQVVGDRDSGSERHDVTDRKEQLHVQHEVTQHMHMHMNMSADAVAEPSDDGSDCMSFGEKYSELFQILDGTLVIGHSSQNLAPHLCMTFDTLLDLANYQNGEILSTADLMEWYKISKNKLVYNKDIDMFNNESTQHLFDEFQKRESMKMAINADMNEEEKQYEAQSDVKVDINRTVKMDKKQREKERKPTRPPMSAKYNHFMKNVEKTNSCNSAPNENKNSNSRRERVISQTHHQNNSKIGLNSNAKTFEPTKSRSSSRTKSVKSVSMSVHNNKSSTPILSLQAAKSVTPQIQQAIMHIAMPQTQTQSMAMPKTQTQTIQQAINGMCRPANINLTNCTRNGLHHPRPTAPRGTQQTVTLRNDPYVNVQQVQQVQNIPQQNLSQSQQTYLLANGISNGMSNSMNAMNASRHTQPQPQPQPHSHNAQISINKMNQNALQRVNSLPLSHQSSNGSLGGNSIEFVQRFTNNVNVNESHKQNQISHGQIGHRQVSHGQKMLNNYQHRAVLQAQQRQQQQQQLITQQTQTAQPLQAPQPQPQLQPPPQQHRFSNQPTVYKQHVAVQQTPFMTPGASISPRIQQQQQFIIKSQANNNHYLVDNPVNHQQILQRIQNHSILQ